MTVAAELKKQLIALDVLAAGTPECVMGRIKGARADTQTTHRM